MKYVISSRVVCCRWVAVLEFLIEVVLWQSIIDGGFVLGGTVTCVAYDG